MTEVYGKLRRRMFVECLQFYLKNSTNEKYNHQYTVHKTFHSICDKINNKQYNSIGHYTIGCNTQAMYWKCNKKMKQWMLQWTNIVSTIHSNILF